MKFKYEIKLKILAILLFWGGMLFAQLPTGDVQFIGANSIDFHINSLDKFENGQTLTGWLWLNIDYDDVVGANEWDLYFKAEDPNLSSGSDNLPNSVIKVTVVSVTGGGAPTTYANVTMDATEQLLVENATGGTDIEVELTIICNDPVTFRSKPEDYYSGIIRFVLRESP